MAFCENVGHSDSGKERPHLNQLPVILEAFRHYMKTGELKDTGNSTIFKVANLKEGNPTLRLDAHYFNPRYFKTMSILDNEAKARGWKIKYLGDLVRSKIAGGQTPRSALYPDEGPKFIRVQNIRPYQIVWNEEDPSIDTRTHNELLSRSKLNEGDVVLTITGTYGIAAVVPKSFGPANINQHSVRIQVNDEILPEYLCIFLNSNLCRPQLDRAATGSTRLALDYPSIRNLRILFPEDKNEQKRLSDEVTAKLQQAINLHSQADLLIYSLPTIPTVTS